MRQIFDTKKIEFQLLKYYQNNPLLGLSVDSVDLGSEDIAVYYNGIQIKRILWFLWLQSSHALAESRLLASLEIVPIHS